MDEQHGHRNRGKRGANFIQKFGIAILKGLWYCILLKKAYGRNKSMNSIFTVEIVNYDESNFCHTAILEMPASWSEYQDALQKARVTDESSENTADLTQCKYEWLHSRIHDEVEDLLEWNLLATRMEKLIKDDMDVFEAMVKIEAKKNKRHLIPIHQLINLALSIENSHFAGNKVDDEELGNSLYDDLFLYNDEYVDNVREKIETGQSVSEFFIRLGKTYRESKDGVPTASGRKMELDDSINEVYIPGETAYFVKSGAPVVLKLSKGSKTVTLDLPLPASQGFDDSLAALDVKNLGKCKYRCVDCWVLSAKDWINAAKDLNTASAFARELDRLEQHGGIIEYKALLEAAKCGDLATALRLTEGIENYQLITTQTNYQSFANDYLNRLQTGANRLDLSEYVDLVALGKKVIEHENMAWTPYGVLKRKDGGPLLSQADQPGMADTRMEMN
jgi:hypothetical protein